MSVNVCMRERDCGSNIQAVSLLCSLCLHGGGRGMYGRRGDVRETKVSNGERQVVLVWTKPSNIHTAPLCIHGSVDKLCGAIEQQDCAVMTTSSSI